MKINTYAIEIFLLYQNQQSVKANHLSDSWDSGPDVESVREDFCVVIFLEHFAHK